MPLEQARVPREQFQRFTTQAQILKLLNAKDAEKGLYSPLANLYASFKMGGGNRSFLDNGAAATYKAAKKMANHQSDVEEEITHKKNAQFGSLMALHASFVDNRIPFKAEFTPVEKLEIRQEVELTFKNHEHLLINYPTSAPQKIPTYHQVYFGQHTTEGKKTCSYFDANMLGGEREGDCHALMDMFIKNIKQSAAHDGRPALVGRSL